MSAQRCPIAAFCRLAAAALVLAGVARAEAPFGDTEEEASRAVSSEESASPGDITVGADRNLWFPETGTNRIGRITTAGAVAEFAIFDAVSLEPAIASGPDGRIWVLGSGLDAKAHVWAVDAWGIPDEIAPLGDDSVLFYPTGMSAGPDGNVWIIVSASIARISPAGDVTRFFLEGDEVPTTITLGPDTNLWFTESIGPFAARRQGLARITTDGTIEQVLYHESKPGSSMPSSIITGPDGNLWFADCGYNEIVRVTLTPVTRTVFPCYGSKLAAGPDGNIWITSQFHQSITRMTPEGASTELGIPPAQTRPLGIVAGPDGNLWFTDPGTGAIGRITPEGVVTEFVIRQPKRLPSHSPRIPRSIDSR